MRVEINYINFAPEAAGYKVIYNNIHKNKECMFLFYPPGCVVESEISRSCLTAN